MAAIVAPHELSTSWLYGSHRRRLVVGAALVIGASLALARLVLAIDIGAVAALLILAGLIAITTRPRWGLYMMFASVLVFDAGSADPLMLPGRYINASLQSTLHLSGAILIPFEMILLLTTAVWLGQATMRRRLEFRHGFFGLPMLLFTLALVFGVIRGTIGGANFNYTFWESRFLFSLVLAYVVAANTIRTRAHVRTLTTLILVCVSLSAIEGIWRKYALINAGLLGSAQETWYSHDGTVIWGLLITLVLAQQVFGGARWQRLLGPFMALLGLFVMLVSERRAGLIALMIAIVVFLFGLITINRKAFLLIALPTTLVAAVYLPLFWTDTGTLGQAARSVRSISSPDPRDAASNVWRDLEAYNVQATIASDPLLGIGFGRPFLQVVTVPDISGFEFWDYEAHHNILWVWMKTGAVGFIIFFVLLLGGIARSIWLAKRLAQPELKTFAMVAMTGIVMTAVFCYVDLGLTGTRLPMLLGVALGTVGVLERIRD